MSTISRNAPVILTGASYDRHLDVPDDDPTSWLNLERVAGVEAHEAPTELAGAKFTSVRVPFKRGDVALYCRNDMHGRDAIAGGHTNYGYSGYFRASVFDGKQWRALKIWDVVPEADRQYASQTEKGEVQARLAAHIEALAGLAVEWGHRAYEVVTPAA